MAMLTTTPQMNIYGRFKDDLHQDSILATSVKNAWPNSGDSPILSTIGSQLKPKKNKINPEISQLYSSIPLKLHYDDTSALWLGDGPSPLQTVELCQDLPFTKVDDEELILPPRLPYDLLEQVGLSTSPPSLPPGLERPIPDITAKQSRVPPAPPPCKYGLVRPMPRPEELLPSAHFGEEMQPQQEEQDEQPDDAARARFSKTQMCYFFANNRCKHGSACRFAHGQEDMKNCPDLRKTSLCHQWTRKQCSKPAALCRFAHGVWDLRTQP
eukprot:TRINITY_DN55220_c0_g1_i1.p1 TRINITY_DN55220_c0_g1~~TRINITY_DN55220_c0_g1_i1.p1  ORF type:complete len:269 (+),score=33.33 TRINITY_DN55220_c0_g1_i1:92-898(+)